MIVFGFTACLSGHVSYEDDLDVRVDLAATESDRLHTPYVRGAAFDITARRDGVVDLSDWQLVSSNELVLDVVDLRAGEDSLTASVEAIGEGEARIELLGASGDLVDARVLEVAFPESVSLRHENALRLGVESDDEFALAWDGQGRYLATYIDDQGRELSGHGVLSAGDLAPLLEVDVDDFAWGEDRDWVTLTSGWYEGAADVELYVDGELADELDVEVVGPADVEEIEVITSDEGAATEGQDLLAWTLGFTMDGREVHGVDATWDAGGLALRVGDTVEYVFDPTEPTDLVAHFGESEDRALIHGSEFPGARPPGGCSATGLGATGALAFLGLLVLRRQRRG